MRSLRCRHGFNQGPSGIHVSENRAEKGSPESPSWGWVFSSHRRVSFFSDRARDTQILQHDAVFRNAQDGGEAREASRVSSQGWLGVITGNVKFNSVYQLGLLGYLRLKK